MCLQIPKLTNIHKKHTIFQRDKIRSRESKLFWVTKSHKCLYSDEMTTLKMKVGVILPHFCQLRTHKAMLKCVKESKQWQDFTQTKIRNAVQTPELNFNGQHRYILSSRNCKYNRLEKACEWHSDIFFKLIHSCIYSEFTRLQTSNAWLLICSSVMDTQTAVFCASLSSRKERVNSRSGMLSLHQCTLYTLHLHTAARAQLKWTFNFLKVN